MFAWAVVPPPRPSLFSSIEFRFAHSGKLCYNISMITQEITPSQVDIMRGPSRTRMMVSREVRDDPTLPGDMRATSEDFPFLRDGEILLSPRGAEIVTGRGASTIRKYMRQGLKTYRFLGARVIRLRDLKHFMREVLKEPGRPRKDEPGASH